MLGTMTVVPASCGRRRRAVAPGFTLVEVMISLVILAVLLAIAVPSMREFVARKRVEGVAQELVTDLRYLQAVQQQRGAASRFPVRISFSSTDTMSCYVLYVWGTAGIDCNCARSDGPVCFDPTVDGASQELKTVVLPKSSGVSFSSDPALLTLDGFNGLPVGNRTIQATIRGTRGGEVRVSTNATAKPSLCSVSGTESSIPRCPP
ncbi:MAG: prepilin-type N-terminal cleavage/methylation domain-containing protein [Aquabacterium sp.]|nr:prepilin-type N-terminal cleavage/methylation domain-containing protein [Aquabacterium sp.]